jgi:5-methylcytosine-specific restriction enzyme A
MPQAVRRACRCNALVPVGEPCPRCTRHRRQQSDRQRTEEQPWRKWYWTPRWRAASKVFLAANPLCAECLRKGLVEAASVVDHRIPHRGDPDLFWDESNWEALGKRCHDRKTARGE